MRVRAVAALLLLGATSSATARATTVPGTLVQVRVALHAKQIALSAQSVPRGYTVEFGVKNATPAARTFSLAGRRIVVPARKLRFLGVEFDRRGRYRVVSRGGGTLVTRSFRVS